MKQRCRCCQEEITGLPILEYKNMPKSAQNFPKEEDLNTENGITLSLYQCPCCGLIQLLDEPVSYYRDVIRASGVSSELIGYRKKYFANFVEEYDLVNKNIIEIGCGCGEFLKIMNSTKANGFGLEHMHASVLTCREQNLMVYEGFIEEREYKIPNAPYDGFFIMNYLEHIPNPNIFLQGICENLKDNAIGLVEVPNVDMVLEKRMFSEFIMDHLMYFTKSTLCLLLEKNGFEVLSCKIIWHDYVLAAVVRKRKKIQLEKFQSQLEKVTLEINQFIDYYRDKEQKVAVWGAGHEALSVLALSEVANKIAYIIDSAKFKQDHYSPGTHIKIVSPEILKTDKISAILVMAASFSDEVAGIIRESYPEINVGILRNYGVEYRGEKDVQ